MSDKYKADSEEDCDQCPVCLGLTEHCYSDQRADGSRWEKWKCLAGHGAWVRLEGSGKVPAWRDN